MTSFETLMQDALYAYDSYNNASTCTGSVYLEQEKEMCGTQHTLLNAIDEAIAAKQAEIDKLMLEFCPERMTEEQIANWEASQQPCTTEAYNAVCHSLGLPAK